MSALRNHTKRPSQHRTAAFLAAVLLGASISARSAFAQNQPAEPQKSTISGTVVNAVTHAPIARALVSSGDNRYATLTDGSGHFEFDIGKENAETNPAIAGGPAMAYSVETRVYISARKPGFIPEGESGATVAPGHEVTISLTPESLIVGRVTLSTAEPPTGLSLELYSRQVVEGLPRWASRGGAQPNSAGEFRFADLPAGSYKLLTHEMLDNDPGAAIAGSQLYGFPPVYYPGAADFAAAATIEVAAGQTVQADLSLARQPYYSVKIPVNGESSNPGINIEVSLQGHKGPGYSLGYSDGDHKIEGLLPNGNYVVTATSYGEKSASGTTHLRVAGTPADGPALTMVPNNGIPLNVKEEFSDATWSSSGSWNVGGRMVPLRGPRLYLQANLEPADDFGQRPNAMIRPPQGPNDDSLVLENVPPGRYWLRLNSSRGYAASATMGSTDVLREPLVVGLGSGAPIEITMRDKFATVEGSIADMSSEPLSEGLSFPRAWIYFVPLPDSTGQYQQAGVFSNGKFTASLTPGSYRVLTFHRQHLELPYRDVEAMRSYENKGQVIQLTAGQKTTLQLNTISGDE